MTIRNSRSIDSVAAKFLAATDNNYRVPKKLHDALQNIFTKTSKSDAAALKFRQDIIETNNGLQRDKHCVSSGKDTAIYNAICLFALIGTALTKKVFSQKFQNKKSEINVGMIDPDKWGVLQHVGITQYDIERINAFLLDDSKNLHNDKLPNIFEPKAKHMTNSMSLLQLLLNDNVSWHNFINTYQNSFNLFSLSHLHEAQQELMQLIDTPFAALPSFRVLQQKINAQIKENEDAWSYIQNKLN